MMKALPLLAALLVVLCWCEATPAQTAAAANAGMAAQLAKARAANAALMKQYTWNSRVEVLEKGGSRTSASSWSTMGRRASSSAIP